MEYSVRSALKVSTAMALTSYIDVFLSLCQFFFNFSKGFFQKHWPQKSVC